MPRTVSSCGCCHYQCGGLKQPVFVTFPRSEPNAGRQGCPEALGESRLLASEGRPRPSVPGPASLPPPPRCHVSSSDSDLPAPFLGGPRDSVGPPREPPHLQVCNRITSVTAATSLVRGEVT